MTQLKTFEEQFPSLKGKLGTFHEETHEPNGAHGYIEWFDPLGDLVGIQEVSEHCLDKQKVRDAIRNPKNFMSSDIGNIPDLEMIERELGL